MTAIKVQNLQKVYKTFEREAGFIASIVSLFKRKHKKVTAVKNVSFEIKKGEIVGFIGPNGAGKSTVIKMIVGILMPSGGEIEALGYVPFKDRYHYVQHIGVVFGQKSQLWWDLPPIDSFYLTRDIYGIEPKKFERRLKHMINLLEVKKIVKTPVRNLSLGERMRCEVISALLHQPKIVLLDEPTIGLDVVAKETIRKFIKKINQKEGTTFLITTHDMDDIEELCKRVIVIDKGKIMYDGLLSELKKKYVKHKIICVDFEESVKGKYCFEVKVNLQKQKISQITSELIKKYPVKDITISEPKIEDVIRTMYREG